MQLFWCFGLALSFRRCFVGRVKGLQQNWCSMASEPQGGGADDGQQPWKECLGQTEATELDNSLCVAQVGRYLNDRLLCDCLFAWYCRQWPVVIPPMPPHQKSF